MKNVRRKALLLASVGLGLVASQAWAAPAPTDVEDRVTQIEEVVVTAQKRSEEFSKVPLSISVADGETLEEAASTRLTDFADYIPGLALTNLGGPGTGAITLRGLSATGATPMVGTYIDDTPFGPTSGWAAGTTFGLDLFPYDLERVEVLRGPQGTLYGANSMGGILKYVTKKPNLSAVSGRLGAEVLDIAQAGDLGWSLRGTIDLPLIVDQMAIRISAYEQDTPGYVDAPRIGASDVGETKQKGVRLTWLWEPTDQLSVRAGAMYQELTADGRSQVKLDATWSPVLGRYQSGQYVPESFDQQVELYTLDVDWDLGWANLTSATGYSKFKNNIVLDTTATFGPFIPLLSAVFTGTPVVGALAPEPVGVDLEKFTQELRLTSPSSERFEWQLGAFYTDETIDNQQGVNVVDAAGAPVASFPVLATVTLPNTYTEYAGFGNATYKFSERLHLTAGARWAHNSQDFTQITGGPLFVFLGAAGTFPGASKEDVFTYSVSPQLFLTDNTMVYARVASGYRPGKPNVTLASVPPMVDADSTVNYEVGIKGAFFDRRLVVDAAAYYVDWSDVQISVSAGGLGYSQNGGKARSQGFEFSTQWLPVEGLKLGFNLAYTDAELTEDVPAVGWTSGSRLPYAPKWGASATFDYSRPLSDDWSMRLGGGWRHTEKRLSGVEGDATTVTVPGYDAVDLNAALSNSRWTLKVYAKNLFDEYGYVSGSIASDGIDAALLQPRTVGVGIDYSF